MRKIETLDLSLHRISEYEKFEKFSIRKVGGGALL